MTLDDVPVGDDRALTAPGKGLDMMLGVVLPPSRSARRPSPSASPRRPSGRRTTHLTRTRFEHLDSSLAELPTLRARLAQMRIETDRARAHLVGVLDSLEAPGPCHAAPRARGQGGGDRGGGGRHRSRDADLRRRRVRRRASVWSGSFATPARRSSWRRRPTRPTTSSAVRSAAWSCSDDRAAQRRRRPVRPEGLGDLGDHPRLLRVPGCADRRRRSTALTSCRCPRSRTAQSRSPGTRRSRGSTRSGDPAGPAARSRCATPIAIASRYFVTRKGGPGSHARRSARRHGGRRRARFAAGDADSARALLRQEGLVAGRDVTARRFDVLVGKHGDHVGGELEAFRCLKRGEAAACAMLDLNWEAWTRDGDDRPGEFATSRRRPRFDHCVFTVRDDLDAEAERRWLAALFAMRYDEPEHREMMDLEGLKAWLPGPHHRVSALTDAVAAERVLRDRGQGRDRAAALSGHHGRQLAAAARAARGAAPAQARPHRPARVRSRRRRRGARRHPAAGAGRLRPGHRRRAASRQLLLVRRREARRRPADDARRDARRRRGQGRLRAAAADARRAGLLDQQPDLRRPSGAARAARARRSAVPEAAHRSARQGHAARSVPADARDVRARR